MSSILKALKKLEQEKTVRRGGNPDLARGILRNVPKGKKRPRWLFPVSVAGAALVASLFTFALMAGFQPAKRSAETVAQSQEAVNAPIVPAQGLSVPLAGSSEALSRSRESIRPCRSESRPDCKNSCSRQVFASGNPAGSAPSGGGIGNSVSPCGCTLSTEGSRVCWKSRPINETFRRALLADAYGNGYSLAKRQHRQSGSC